MDNPLADAKRIFIIGIKGNGTSALAHILAARGVRVTGSDVKEDFVTKPLLDELHIAPVLFGKATSFEEQDVIIYSTSVQDDNPDLLRAREEGKTLLSYPEALGALGALFETSIAVCGSHGKSTITALSGYMLEKGGLDPTALVGAEVTNWKRSARAGKSTTFLFEADEYQNKFRHYTPKILVISNINYEHPDFFPDFKSYKNTFADFAKKIPEDGLIIANRDHPTVTEVAKASGKKVLWYGEHEKADIRLTGRKASDGKQIISINNEKNLSLSLMGKHNAHNALSVVGLAEHLDVGDEALAESFSTFNSTKRRLEFIGVYKDAVVIDDFAHHPTEIVASLSALKEAYNDRRIVCIFQSHTFTRTKALLSDFAKAFQEVDELILIPIFGSARETHGGITTEEFKDAIKEYTPNTHIVETNKEAVTYLKNNTESNNLVVTMGAGDTWQIARDLVE